ncbi:MAG: outer membrane protein [Rhodomicrobium sp.]
MIMKLRNGILGLTLTSAFALTAFSANAADIYQGPGGYKDGPVYAPQPVWAGVYAGINGGYGWSNENQLADPFWPFGGVSPSGGFGGGQLGYNWQSGHFVFGFETDLQGSAIGDRGVDVNGSVYKSNLDYFGTVRGRLGYAFDNALLYATGGFAYGGLSKYTNDGGNSFRYSDTAGGYVVGGGIEYKINPAWSVKAEYQYINLGNNDLIDPFVGSFNSFTGVSKDDDYHTFRVGLNYRFGGSDYVPFK